MFSSSRAQRIFELNHIRTFSTVLTENYISLLEHLGANKQLSRGKSVHSLLIRSGLTEDAFVQNNLIKFYGNCHNPWYAGKVFHVMPEPNLVSWTSLISSYVHNAEYDAGLNVFVRLCRSGLPVNEFGYSVSLKACKTLHNFKLGLAIHGRISKCGFESDRFCNASLLGLYIEAGDVASVHKLFNGIPLWERSEALWNTLLDSYVASLDVVGAVKLFYQMLGSCVMPSCFTYSILIKLCGNASEFGLGRAFHGLVIKSGFESESVAGAALLDSYVRFGLLDDACKIFWYLEERDNMLWSTLLAGFHQIGEAGKGLLFYLNFLSEGNNPDEFIYASVFSLCSDLGILLVGAQVHCSFVKYGLVMDSFLGSALINMYSEMGMILDSYRCFLEVQDKEEMCYASMINNLVSRSYYGKALELFSDMLWSGILPKCSTLSDLLRTCGSMSIAKEGRSIHSHILKYSSDLHSDLIQMYADCGHIDEARIIFNKMETKDEFSWTTVVGGCNQSERFQDALELFRDMFLQSSIRPSQYTVVSVLQACTKLKALADGEQVHDYVIKVGFEANAHVGSALINMYAANYQVQDAFRVFLSLGEKDFISWSSMITAWAQNRRDRESLELFSHFQKDPSFMLDDTMLSTCLAACAGMATLEMGKWFHAYVIRTGFGSYLKVASSLIDMYSKCGHLNEAHKLFDDIEVHNLVSWTAMISGYAHHGRGEEAIKLFDEMKRSGLEPDGVTFLAVLTACNHAGLVKEGCHLFQSLQTDYDLGVTVNHYASMVDLLGRAERVDEAEALINESPFKSKYLLWKTLLGACKKHGNIEAADRAAKMMAFFEPNEPSRHVLLSNIYASVAMWDNSVVVRKKMKEQSINKLPGYSWLQSAG